MRAVDRETIEKMVVIAICDILASQKRSKKWLANELSMDYGKVKRLLSLRSKQQLTISIAERMLRLLGSDLHTVIMSSLISEIRHKIIEVLNEYRPDR
jgi:hypothetical protein